MTPGDNWSLTSATGDLNSPEPSVPAVWPGLGPAVWPGQKPGGVPRSRRPWIPRFAREAEFLPLPRIHELRAQFEAWSQICIDALLQIVEGARSIRILTGFGSTRVVEVRR
jgi:hypothetical protein